MRIDINELKEGITKYSLKETPEELGLKGEYRFKGPIVSEIEIDNMLTEIAVKGSIKASLFQECSRCLKEYSHKISAGFSLVYFKKGSFKEGGLNKEEIDEQVLTSDILDVGEDVRQTVLLEVPVKPVCKESCRGICMICGKNKNLSKCDCKVEWNNPFAALKDLKLISNRKSAGVSPRKKSFHCEAMDDRISKCKKPRP